MAVAPLIPAFLMSSLNFPVYFIMGSLDLSLVTFNHLYNLSNSKYAFPSESISSQFAKNLVLNPVQSFHHLAVTVSLSRSTFSFSFHCCASSLMLCRVSRILNCSVLILFSFIVKYSSIFVMNSLAVFCFPLKEGHDPKRFVGAGAVAIVGGPSGGLGGGVGGGSGLGSGVLGGSTSIGSPLFSGSSFSPKGSGVLGDPGLSTFIDSPCPDKDNPVKGLSTECSARSLESGSC